MKKTKYIIDGKELWYEIFDDGYDIYLDGIPWISQRGRYSKPVDKKKSFEENCLMQMEGLTRVPEEPNNDYGVPNETYDAIIDEYTLSLMESGVL